MKSLNCFIMFVLLAVLLSGCATRQKGDGQANTYQTNGADSTKTNKGYKPKDERNAAVKIVESLIDYKVKEQQEKIDKKHPAQKGWPPRNN